MGDSSKILKVIEGGRLVAITFVMDYVQLQFDDGLLTLFTWPTVKIGSVTFKWKDIGFRDALCELITHEVVSTSVREHDAVKISFDNLAAVDVSLKEADYRCPEALTFRHSSGFWVL